MATLKDIARACGTSTATVSYVLSGRGNEKKISEQMQKKILETAKAFKYEYRSKRKPHNKPRVALYWPRKHITSLMRHFMSGIESAMFYATDPVDIIIKTYQRNFLENQTELWTAGSYDSVVIVSPGQDDMNVLSERKTKVPAVLINRCLPDYYSVSINNSEAGRLAADQALEFSGDSAALVVPAAKLYGAGERVKAVRERYSEKGIDIINNVYYCDNSMDAGAAVGREMLSSGNMPKTIICVYDESALGIVSAMNDAGVELGKDVKVVVTGSSYGPLLKKLYPRVSVIDLRQEDVASLGLKMGIDISGSKPCQNKNILLHPEIISGSK